jgi:formylglycine-generating enzyme required for sulfatase activity
VIRLTRHRSTIGGAVGLTLLVLAFAYRWVGFGETAPTPIGDAPSGEAREAIADALRRPAAEAPPAATVPVPVETPVVTDAPSGASLAEVSEEVLAEVDDALARAAEAVEQGHLVDPILDSALYWYDAALELDPGNKAAHAGRQKVLETAVAQASAALDEGDAKPATDLLVALQDFDVAPEAKAALAQRIQNLPRVTERLREAAQRMAAGQGFEPEGASALDSYRAALAVDPRNLAGRQGLAEIEQAILTQALSVAASEDQYLDADRLLALAATVTPDSQAQRDTRVRIDELKRQRANALLARADAALDTGSADAAEPLIEQAAALGANAADVAQMRERVENARTYANLSPGEVFKDAFVDRAGNGPDLVVLPLGEFDMGSPDSERSRKDNEGPLHRVRIAKAVALGKTEVTVAEFRRFVTASKYVTDAEKKGSSSYYDEKTGRIAVGQGIDWRRDFMGEKARNADPVVHVSWNDASAYASWLAESTGKTYRLPSEAEFEYALRAGRQTRYPWGDGNPTRVIANLTGDGDRSNSKRTWTNGFPRYRDGYWGPSPAGTFPPNAYGLYDLEGNLSEWVEDCWHDSYLRAPDDGSAWVNKGCDKRVVRGGSWGSAPDQVRSAFRLSSSPAISSSRVGFRVAREL